MKPGRRKKHGFRAMPRKQSTRDYMDILYTQWRKDVRARDGNKCKWMGCDDHNNLQVHHIMKWSDFPLMRYTLSNGITLCKKHHDFIKGMEENYQEFLFKCLSLQ